MEDKIKELEERIEKLERKEKNRKILSAIKVLLFIIIIGILIYFGIRLYNRVLELIEPYKNITDTYNLNSIKDLFR